MSKKSKRKISIDAMLKRIEAYFERASRKDIRYIAYGANALGTLALSEILLKGKRAGTTDIAALADDYWIRLVVTGMMPIVLMDTIFRAALSWFGTSPFKALLITLFEHDRALTQDSDGDWYIRQETIGLITLLFSVQPILIVEGSALLAAQGSILQGVGNIIPG